MTGTSSTEHGEPAGQDGPEQPRPGEPVKDKEGFPWQLAVSVVTWIVFGGLLVASALGVTSTTSGADQGSIDAVQGALGPDAVATGSAGSNQHPTLFLLLGLVMLLMALMLLIGQGWSRYVLGVLALISVIMFAAGGRWEAIVAMVLMVIGLVFLLNRNTLRYLS